MRTDGQTDRQINEVVAFSNFPNMTKNGCNFKNTRLAEITFFTRQTQSYWKLLLGNVAPVMQFWNIYWTD
jgi:hypothetical protein